MHNSPRQHNEEGGTNNITILGLRLGCYLVRGLVLAAFLLQNSETSVQETAHEDSIGQMCDSGKTTKSKRSKRKKLKKLHKHKKEDPPKPNPPPSQNFDPFAPEDENEVAYA